jgi:hypothetical protein
MSTMLMAASMFGVAALLWGAALQWRQAQRQRAVLMAIAALVIAGNVAIWTVPLGH